MNKTVLRTSFYLLVFLFIASSANAQLRVGDPGVTFDASKYDSDYPEMKEWQKAGVEGGVPFLTSTYKKTIWSTNSDGLNSAIITVSNQGGGQILLKNGTYTINKTVNLKNNVRLVGESRNGVKLNITMTGTTGNAVQFGCTRAGIDRLTIQGGYGVPNDYKMENVKPNFNITSVNFNSSAKNCWLDNVRIINSGTSAISTWRSSHLTIRDCYIERAWNKGGGGRGYVQFAGDHCLMYNTTVKKMRHIAIQREGCKYNVFYKNIVEQDFNFHNADAGYNLVEANTSTLPSGLGSGWHSMMGPWSIQHNEPGPRNAIYKNKCRENNNGGRISFSDNSKVYIPARHENNNPFNISNNTPKGGTFYPVVLGSTNSDAPIGKTIWLKTYNKYVCCEKNTTSAPLMNNRTAVGGWEQFTVVNAGSGKIALKALANGKYVRANSSVANTPLQAISTSIGSQEKFTWQKLGTNKVALKASNGKYVQARQNETNAPLKALGSAVQGWETFTWGEVSKKSALVNEETDKTLIYPNPLVGNTLNIKLPSQSKLASEVTLLNASSAIIHQSSSTESTRSIQTKGLQSGMYILKVRTGNQVSTHKVIVP